eukprot:6350353-Amphidinium_carterae.1
MLSTVGRSLDRARRQQACHNALSFCLLFASLASGTMIAKAQTTACLLHVAEWNTTNVERSTVTQFTKGGCIQLQLQLPYQVACMRPLWKDVLGLLCEAAGFDRPPTLRKEIAFAERMLREA